MRGAIIDLLGSAERAFYPVERIDAERRSVPRMVPAVAVTAPAMPRKEGQAMALHPTRRSILAGATLARLPPAVPGRRAGPYRPGARGGRRRLRRLGDAVEVGRIAHARTRSFSTADRRHRGHGQHRRCRPRTAPPHRAGLAEICLGRVARWSDTSLRALNRQIALRDTEITVVCCSDGSGTIFNFTDVLGKASSLFDWSLTHGSAEAATLRYVPPPPTLVTAVKAYWAETLGSAAR